MESNDFELKSKIERIALLEIFKYMYLLDKYDYKTGLTEHWEIYDGYGMRFDKETGSQIDSQLFEVKCRDQHYPDLLLEKKKFEALKDKGFLLDSKIYYCCVTPSGTFIYDLLKIEKELGQFKYVKEEHWKSTSDKSRGKVMKFVTYIPTSKAKFINIKTGDLKSLLIKNELEVQNRFKEQKKESKFYLWLLTEGILKELH